MASARAVSSVFRRGLFDGKVAIVTGGATGIGSAIAQELLYLGCNVMIASRGEEKLRAAAEAMRCHIDTDAKLATCACNIRKEDEVNNLISHTLSKFGRVDMLINNAGGQFISHVGDITAKGWAAVIETNLTGTFYCCKAAYNQWMEKNGGCIVNIIADMVKGMPMMGHSGAARAGVDNLTKTLAVEWAESGVRVNAVIPGSSIYSETAAKNYGDPRIFEEQIVNIPAKRLGHTEEISAAVTFLLSPGAAFISGTTVKVDGAHSLYRPSIPYNVPDHKNSKPYKWSEDKVKPKL